MEVLNPLRCNLKPPGFVSQTAKGLKSKCSGITATNNVAAGSFHAGFCTYSYDCTDDATAAAERGNEAHSARFGAWVLSHSLTCSKYGGITVHKTVENGLSLQGRTAKYMASNVISADNRVGIAVRRRAPAPECQLDA